MSNSEKLISIIIVNYNGLKWLERCLSSLQNQTYKNFEIILVDNASHDSSVEFVRQNYPSVIVIQNDTNSGFAGGNNLGYASSRGEYILLLNNDTFVEENYLQEFLQAFEQGNSNIAAVQSKIVLMNDSSKLDVCGAYWTDFSFLYYFGCFKDASLEIYNKPMPFFSNKGASQMIKREAIEKIGLFDEDFWCYYEETDFCHRAWLAGYECWYYPKAICYHANGGTSTLFDNANIQFHNFKNKLTSLLKNFSGLNLLTIIPIYLFFCVLISLVWLFTGKFKHFTKMYSAIAWNIVNIRKIVDKRKKVQALRAKTDREIFQKVRKNPRISYYLYLFGNLANFKD